VAGRIEDEVNQGAILKAFCLEDFLFSGGLQNETDCERELKLD
jgi:hypothetical protein